MPVTGVSGSPALNVSTVFGSTGALICSLIFSITWRAVKGFCACAGQALASRATAASRAHRSNEEHMLGILAKDLLILIQQIHAALIYLPQSPNPLRKRQ